MHDMKVILDSKQGLCKGQLLPPSTESGEDSANAVRSKKSLGR